MISTQSTLSILAFCFITAFSSTGQTYTTLADGAWNDVATVWSTDGFTPCGCTPGGSSGGSDIIINHNITSSYNLVFSGGSLVRVNASGSLSGTHNINTWNSTIDFFSAVNMDRFGTGVNANVTFHTGALITFTGQVQITDGTVNIDGALLTTGQMTVGSNGTINMINASRIFGATSNTNNHGLINLCASCCLSSNGNWRNRAGGTITGSGAVNSGGNVQNDGIWDINVSWCASGTGLGLPNPEDCATAQGTCNAIVLPIELTSFTAELTDDYVTLDWATASEINNDYFQVMKSEDGMNWKEIDRIDGAGTTTEAQYYTTYDENPAIGTTYYQLIQHDFDGRENESPVVSITNNGDDAALVVYPNPASGNTFVTVENVENGDNVMLRSAAGNTMISQSVTSFSRKTTLDISQLLPGMYFINTDKKNTAIKLIVTR